LPELDKAKTALGELGWSEYESRTYSALVQLGKATASKIAKNSNVPPNRVYQILSKLSERGVVHTTEARGTATEYEATDPEIVLNRQRDEYSGKIETAKTALNELKERKQDTAIPITYTIYGKRELSTYLQNTLTKATSSVFVAVDTLIEIRNRQILKTLNNLANSSEIDIKVLTTTRGINDDYEQEVANDLEKNIGLKVSTEPFSTIFMIIDDRIMIYTAYGFHDHDRGEQDYYGIYTEDQTTTKLLQRPFLAIYDEAEFFRDADKKAEEEIKEDTEETSPEEDVEADIAEPKM
jgi:sugar-specific transcriptional regulator TrmB